MKHPLYDHVIQQLQPVVAPVATLLHIQPAQSHQALYTVAALTIKLLQQALHERGAEPARQLLDANLLQNIPADAPLSPELVWTARDTGRPLLDKYLLEGDSRQQVLQQLSQQLSVDPQTAQDVLQTYLTLSVRSLSLWASAQALDAAGLQPYLEQEQLDDASLPDWLNQRFAQLPPAQPSTALPPVGEVPVQTTRAAAQSSREKQSQSLLSQYGLHLGFAILALIPFLVFFKSCNATQAESERRQQQTPATIDTGMNGEGRNVLPRQDNLDNPASPVRGSAPTAPAATELVPHSGTPATTPLPENTAVARADHNTATAATNNPQSVPVVIPGNTAADSDPNVATARAQ